MTFVQKRLLLIQKIQYMFMILSMDENWTKLLVYLLLLTTTTTKNSWKETNCLQFNRITICCLLSENSKKLNPSMSILLGNTRDGIQPHVQRNIKKIQLNRKKKKWISFNKQNYWLKRILTILLIQILLLESINLS